MAASPTFAPDLGAPQAAVGGGSATAVSGMATSTSSSSPCKRQQQQQSAAAASSLASGGPVAGGGSSSGMHTCWIVIGPAGTGKSTVAEFLASALGAPFIEGDGFHPQANIAKMSAGIPLTDEDRWEWLATLRDECVRRLSAGAGAGADVVLTCSALKRSYRDVMRAAALATGGGRASGTPDALAGSAPVDIRVRFVYLHAPEEVVTLRALARKGHYMAASMVRSQYSILEPPGEEEREDVIWVDATGTMAEVECEVLAKATALRAMDREMEH